MIDNDGDDDDDCDDDDDTDTDEDNEYDVDDDDGCCANTPVWQLPGGCSAGVSMCWCFGV